MLLYLKKFLLPDKMQQKSWTFKDEVKHGNTHLLKRLESCFFAQPQ